MSAIFSLNSEKTTMSVGSVYKFRTNLHEGTLNVDDVVWSVTNEENCKFVSDKENSTFTATTKGDFVVTAKYGDYIASCDIKVVSDDAEKLANPTLSINDCKNIQWESVEGVTEYLLSIDGEEWISIDKNVTTYDVSSITDKLLSGESNTFFLLASAAGDYDHVDSDIQELNFSHAYNGVYTLGKEATCQKIGEINYECQTCKKAYTDSNYVEPHRYVDGQCEKCKECRTTELAYEYDDNYIPIPSPEEAKDKSSWWWQKYSKYLTKEVNPEGTTNYTVLWKKLNDIKDTIAEEDRIKCYCVSWLKDGDINEVYVPSTHQDTKYHPDALPVYYVKPNAFARFASLRKVVFSETTRELRGLCFNECSQLETVIMPGLAVFPAIDITNVYQTNNFQECFSLKRIVVGKNYTNAGRNFVYFDLEGNHKEYVGQVDIYVSSPLSEASKATVTLDASNYANKGFAGLLSFNYYFMDDEACGTWKYNQDKTDVIFNEHYYQNGLCKKCGKCDPIAVGHNFVDGICIECQEEQSSGLVYEYDARLEGYVVSKGTFVGEEAYIRAEYDDGVHGEKPVIALTNFASSMYLKKVVLPESVKYIGPLAFGSCVNLETVIMPGVKDFYAIKDDKIDFDTTDARNTFFNTPKLEEVVVNSNITIRRKVFYTDLEKYPALVKTTLYVVGEMEIDLTNSASLLINILSGEQHLYDETGTKCASWRFVNGNIEKIGNHVFVNGKCKYCLAHDANGLTYVYKTIGDFTGYVLVNDNKLKDTDTTIIVPSVYNDGANGEANVIAVEGAFINNGFVRKIVLPDTVKYIGGAAFGNCAELQSVVMNGVEDFYVIIDGEANFESPSARNTFYRSAKMKELVVGKQINAKRSKIFFTDKPLDNPILNIFVYGDQKIALPTTNAQLLTGEQYVYDENKACGTWHYEGDVPVVTAAHIYNDTCTCVTCGHVRDEAHVYEDGLCKACGAYQTKGLAYEQVTLGNETGYAVKIGDCKDTEIYVPKTYEGMNVIAVNHQFAWANGTITKIVLPKEVKYLIGAAFGNMSKLQTVIMPGVVDICYTDYSFTSGSARNTFYRDVNLKVLVINQSLNLNRAKTFFTDRYNASGAVLDIYVYNPDNPNQVSAVTLPTSNAQLLSGKQYLYSETEKCGFWSNLYNPTYKAHVYTDEKDYTCNDCGEMKEHAHVDNLENPTGKCTYCNKVLSEGLVYTPIEDGQAYEVSKGTCADATIYVLSEYNGKPVTTVGKNGFQDVKATKIVLPRSVKNVKYAAFFRSAIQTVIMPGVVNFADSTDTYNSGSAKNTFLSCTSLTSVVLGSSAKMTSKIFPSLTGVTCFVDGETTIANASFFVTQYLKSEWQYNSDGVPMKR